MSTTTVNPLVREAQEKVQDIERKVQEFFDKVNDVLSWVPGFLSHLIEPIRAGIEALNQKLREFWDRVNQLWDQPGNSDRLKEVGEQWVTQVGNITGDIAGTISPDQLRTNIEWTGRAAEAYRATIPAQVSGLNAVKDLANQMRSSLNNLANSIDGLWTALGFAFAGFVVGAVAAIATAVTVVGIPAAIAILATAVGVALGLIAAAIMALNSHLNTIESEQATIAQKARDLGTTWANTNIDDLSDASVTDGDGSDWRVNQ
jgi:uncharacterized protein YoxC